MLRFLLKHTPVKRLARGMPIVALLSAAEVARLAHGHLREAGAGRAAPAAGARRPKRVAAAAR